MTTKPTQPTLTLRSANFDILTGRMNGLFADEDGNMLTVNSAIVPGSGKDQAAAVRAAFVALLRQAADHLETEDGKA